MRPDDPEPATTDRLRNKHATIAYTALLILGSALILASVVVALVALRAEWQTADAKGETQSAESRLADINAATADLASRRVEIETLAANLPQLHADVVTSWNAVTASVDAALSTVTRANSLFNDGKVVRAKQLLDTEADRALRKSEDDLEKLRSEAQELDEAATDLREHLDDSEQP